MYRLGDVSWVSCFVPRLGFHLMLTAVVGMTMWLRDMVLSVFDKVCDSFVFASKLW
jgi:hypothetical protein